MVLTVTQMLSKKGVVGKFVEYYGEGLAGLPLADRATIANMAPEYRATCGIFPIDAETIRYMSSRAARSADPPDRSLRQPRVCSSGRGARGPIHRHPGP